MFSGAHKSKQLAHTERRKAADIPDTKKPPEGGWDGGGEFYKSVPDCCCCFMGTACNFTFNAPMIFAIVS